jgi:hypothetical protein
MLPENFSFAQLPPGKGEFTLREVGMSTSTIEDIDSTLLRFLKEDLELSTVTSEGFTTAPVIWIAPERTFQIKNNQLLRDESGTLKMPLISVERTGLSKDPTKKGSFQAHLFSNQGDGRSGRMVIARQIVQDKTRDNAVAVATNVYSRGEKQQYFPRVNQQVVIKTLSIPIPVYVNLEYKITIKTEFQTQMNDLITPFITRTGQINCVSLMNNNHVYEAFIEQSFSPSNNVASLGEEERIFTTEVKIRVLGYLIGEPGNQDRPIVKREESIVKVLFPSETTVPSGNDQLI